MARAILRRIVRSVSCSEDALMTHAGKVWSASKLRADRDRRNGAGRAVMLEMLSISVAAVIAVAECDLEPASGQKGILGAMALAGTIAGSASCGDSQAATLGRRKVIIPTLLMTNAVSFASSMMTNFWMITICRFLTGFL
ncbi:hypothetical protein pipiens_019603 [Culex pipiens pipiens]|uniref:Uncharacterized protein n=1 Tax=Culex pipiens pipiens TaxID=38569 RepID=A0ABD1DTF1_CULPP